MTSQARRAHLQFLMCGVAFAVVGLAMTYGTESIEAYHQEQVRLLAAERQSEWEYQFRLAALYEKLDPTHSKLVYKEDLRNAILEEKLSGVELADALLLCDDFEKIGHVVGHYRSGKFGYNVYAISPVDLTLHSKSLEDRLKRKYGNHYMLPQVR